MCTNIPCWQDKMYGCLYCTQKSCWMPCCTTSPTSAIPTHLCYVSTGLLAQRTDGVDAADALGKHGVGCQLGQLCTPQVGGQDALARNPVCVHVRQNFDGALAILVLHATNQHLQLARHKNSWGMELPKGGAAQTNMHTHGHWHAFTLLHLCSQACCCLSCHKGFGTTVAERSPCLACPGPQLLFPLPRTRGC